MTCPLGLCRALTVPPSHSFQTKTILMGSDVHLHLACLIDVNTVRLNPQSFPPSRPAPPPFLVAVGFRGQADGVIIRMAALIRGAACLTTRPHPGEGATLSASSISYYMTRPQNGHYQCTKTLWATRARWHFPRGPLACHSASLTPLCSSGLDALCHFKEGHCQRVLRPLCLHALAFSVAFPFKGASRHPFEVP